MKKRILMCAIVAWSVTQALPCTGISLTAADGAYVQARTIEAGAGELKSEYVIIPRGEVLQSFTPTGRNGLRFEARYGVVGMSVERKEFICEGINEAGLSAGLFFFPRYGSYISYEPSLNEITLGDLQVPAWILTQFASIDELKRGLDRVRIVGLDAASVVHYRVGEPSGRQIVIEFVDGETHVYENPVGVLTNSPGFPWHLTNLDNYVNIHAGNAPAQQMGQTTLMPTGANSGFLGLPGDATPPSRFVRVAFYRATAPQQSSGRQTILQCFHILNNFDIPIGTEHAAGSVPDIPSATQWTSAIDLTNRLVYYKTAYNNTIRCIDLSTIDFSRVKYQSHPMDEIKEQPVVMIAVK